MKKTFKNIDDYIAIQTPEVQILLEQMRQTIKNAAPEAEELISYNMPAFKYHGMLVYFAAYKNHIGFYATPTGHSQFNQALSLELISRIVKFRMEENLKKVQLKNNKSKTTENN